MYTDIRVKPSEKYMYKVFLKTCSCVVHRVTRLWGGRGEGVVIKRNIFLKYYYCATTIYYTSIVQ